LFDRGGRVALAIHQCSKPTIAAINGSAVGGEAGDSSGDASANQMLVGITMTLPACIRVTFVQAKIGFVFARRGLILEACSSYFLPRLIGMSRALNLVTTGSVYRADHPLLQNLFSETLPSPEATVARALELADDIARTTSTVSTKLMRDLMYRGPDSAEATHLLDSRVIHSLFGSRDSNEGIQSFFEKRSPRFQGTMQDNAPEAYPWWDAMDVKINAQTAGKGSKAKL
jgi:enoyl-CoA hydratase/carnithine racemase